MQQIRLVHQTDIPALATMLGRSFSQDPFWCWMVGEHGDQQQRLALGFAAQLRHLALPGGLVWCAEHYQGAALWSAPGQWHLGFFQQLRFVPDFIRVTGWRRLWTVSRAVQAVQDAHPTEPHYYLQVLGVDPAHQGQGWSTVFLQEVLQRCDQEQIPAYLETAGKDTVSLYLRHGFVVTNTLKGLPGNPPPLWCMWREPQSLPEQ